MAIINEHYLVHADDAGNGYHGNCKYCGLAFVTDLGYFSWKDTTCIDREITDYRDIPDNIKSYANFNGLSWNYERCVFIKSYSEREYTIDQLINIVAELVR